MIQNIHNNTLNSSIIGKTLITNITLDEAITYINMSMWKSSDLGTSENVETIDVTDLAIIFHDAELENNNILIIPVEADVTEDVLQLTKRLQHKLPQLKIDEVEQTMLDFAVINIVHEDGTDILQTLSLSESREHLPTSNVYSVLNIQ